MRKMLNFFIAFHLVIFIFLFGLAAYKSRNYLAEIKYHLKTITTLKSQMKNKNYNHNYHKMYISNIVFNCTFMVQFKFIYVFYWVKSHLLNLTESSCTQLANVIRFMSLYLVLYNLVFGSIRRRLMVALFCAFRLNNRLSKTQTSAVNEITLFIVHICASCRVQITRREFLRESTYTLHCRTRFFFSKIYSPWWHIFYYTCTQRVVSRFTCTICFGSIPTRVYLSRNNKHQNENLKI